MPKHGKKYLDAAKKVDSNKLYSVAEAMKLVKETSYANFDATVDVAYNLSVDPKQADQQIRGSIVLPNGTGKTQTVVVFAEGPQADQAFRLPVRRAGRAAGGADAGARRRRKRGDAARLAGQRLFGLSARPLAEKALPLQPEGGGGVLHGALFAAEGGVHRDRLPGR